MSRRTLRLLVVLPSLLLSLSVRAQPAYRVKDIDPQGNSTWPSGLTVAGGRLFFVADDGPHGPELWTSDGTGPGTTRVPGTSGIWTVFAGSAAAYFFKAGGGLGDLWKSDGTEAGTTLVKAGVGLAMESAVAGTLTFFSNSRLWRTDGTPAGTYQLFGNDGQEPVNVQQLASSNGILYFFAAGSSLVDTLWRSDGTAAGTFTVLLSPVSVSLPSYSSLRPMIGPFDSRFFFAASEATHGLEIWASDGTDPGTSLFRDLEPGTAPSNPQQFTRSGSRLYFVANTPNLGWRIWSTDGNPANTAAVDSFVGGFRSITNLTDVSGRLAFQTLGDYGIWTSDGTNAGTIRLRTGDASNLAAAGGRLFFSGPFGQLWTSDLTPAGTRLVRSFGILGPTFLTEFGGFLYFFADDGAHGPQLWRSDGTPEGTTLVRLVRPGFVSSNPTQFAEAAGTLFLLASSADVNGSLPQTRLWKSDGTEAGTLVVSDVSGDFMASIGRHLFFPGPGLGQPLWETDGSPAGTLRIAGQPDGLAVQDRSLIASGGRAFWIARVGSGDPELWVADSGLPAAARKVSSFQFVSDLVDMPGGTMFGAASTDVTYDLWRSDGTALGTRVVHEFRSFQPILIQRAGARRFVLTSVRTLDPLDSRQLWVTDGTEAGTALAWDSGPRLVGGIFFVGSMRGKALFRVYDQAGDLALWRSDGTAAGTFVLHTFAGPAALGEFTTTFDGTFFSVSPDGVHFPQLWSTDGSVSGTRLVRDFSDLAASLPPVGKLLDVAGSLLFGLRADAGEQLWSSDGNLPGTNLFQAGVSAVAPIYYLPGPGLAVGSHYFFAGFDPFGGAELWALPLTAAFRPRATSLSLLSPCRILDTREATGFLGGPALLAGLPRVFPVGDTCGIPWTARSIAANVTVTNATADGVLRVHASDIGAPEATAINFTAGQTRANNVMIALGPDAEFTVRFETAAPAGEVHVIVDIVGFFE